MINVCAFFRLCDAGYVCASLLLTLFFLGAALVLWSLVVESVRTSSAAQQMNHSRRKKKPKTLHD